MKIQDIPAHLGITAAALADLMGKSKSALNNYTSGRKGVTSKFISETCAVAGLEREEVFFPDVFDSPFQEEYHRHLSCAVECLEMAKRSGAAKKDIELFQNMILRYGRKTIPEVSPQDLEQ